MKTASFYKSGKSKRQIWSRRAVIAKERVKLECALSPQADIVFTELAKTRPARFAVKINLERRNGARLTS